MLCVGLFLKETIAEDKVAKKAFKCFRHPTQDVVFIVHLSFFGVFFCPCTLQ